MSELKTLKDLTGLYDACTGTPEDILRQEAIKWVLQHRNIKPNWAKETNEEFFMGFFNLTEEDLK